MRTGLRRGAGAVIRSVTERALRLAAIGPDDATGRRFGHFGEGSAISYPTGAMFGERWIHLGAGTLVGPQATLSVGMVPGQTMVTDPVIRIGDRCLIGRGTAIVGHFGIDIGDDVYTGMNVYITDQNHGYTAVDEPIGTQRPIEEQVSIGSSSWIGSGAVILPGAAIGEHVVIGANSVVRGVVPSRSVAVGVPARVVRRHTDGRWTRVDGPL